MKVILTTSCVNTFINLLIKVRSASFDEIKLEAQRTAQYLHQSSTDSQLGLLVVPTNQQRSRSFDSAGIESSDANASFLDVPKRFQRRKSSAKPPVCIHCQYVEEQRKRSGSAGFYFDAQEFRALTYSDTSSSSSSESEKEKDDENDVDYFLHQQNTLLLPSPCSITFTLSPTNCDYPAFPLPAIVPGSPPAMPSISPFYPASPTIEFSNELELDDIPGPRQRRRSISRQEAIFVEPTGTSLENVSNASDSEQPKEGYENQEDAQEAITLKVDEPFVRDIFLAVPDLKRDRAASVDSCFTKVSSAAKTEEVQPAEGDLNLLNVPSGAIRSRSVDIVLPTEQQARYKALALAGPANNIYGKG